VIVEITFLGLAVATLFVEATGIYPGGIIVPGYVALFLDQPLRILGTVVVGLLSWGCYRVLSRWVILYGRRRFVLIVLLGGVWAIVGYRILPSLWPASVDLRVIGWVIPGLIGNAIERQGFWMTLAAMGVASTVVFVMARLLFRV